MNESTTSVTTEELLFARVIDHEATEADWTALERRAERDAALWRRLADAQRAHESLSAALAQKIDAADEVEAPVHVAVATEVMVRRWGVWAGWAAAAVVALAWAGVGSAPRGPGGMVAGFDGATTDEAFDAYLRTGVEEGRVLAEGPTVLLETRLAPDGRRVEVVFLRQVYERRLVEDVYQLSQDDQGEYSPVPVEIRLVSDGEEI